MRSRHWGHKPLCRFAFSVPTIGACSPFLSGAHRSGFCASVASQRPLRICCIAASSAERQALPFRLPLRSIPPQRPRPGDSLIWRRRSPVWLAIWRTWVGFANSQHRDAAFATPNNICAHSSLLPHWAAAQTLANLSAHLLRLPTPPPYLRQMRLSPGRDAGVGWQMLLLVVRGAVPANHRAHESLF